MYDASESKSSPTDILSEDQGIDNESNSTNNLFNLIIKRQKPQPMKITNSILETVTKDVSNLQTSGNHTFQLFRKSLIKEKVKGVIDDPVDDNLSKNAKLPPLPNPNKDVAPITSHSIITQRSNLRLNSSLLNNSASKNQGNNCSAKEQSDIIHKLSSIDTTLSHKVTNLSSRFVSKSKLTNGETLTEISNPCTGNLIKNKIHYSIDEIFNPRLPKSKTPPNDLTNEAYVDDPIIISFRNSTPESRPPKIIENVSIEKPQLAEKSFNMFDFLYNRDFETFNKPHHIDHTKHSIISSKKRANRISSTIPDASYDSENNHVKNLIKTARISTNSEESKRSNSKKLTAIKGGLLSRYRKFLSKNNYHLDCINTEMVKLRHPLYYDPPKLIIRDCKHDMSYLNNEIPHKQHENPDFEKFSNYTHKDNLLSSDTLSFTLQQNNSEFIKLNIQNLLHNFISKIETFQVSVKLFSPIRHINNTSNVTTVLGYIKSLNDIDQYPDQISLLLLTRHNSMSKILQNNKQLSSLHDSHFPYARDEQSSLISFLIFYYSFCHKSILFPIISPILVADIDFRMPSIDNHNLSNPIQL